MAKKKAKIVADSQLSDDIEKLLEKKGVDEDVITEVTAKINDTNEDEDADGEVLNKDEDIDIEEKDDEKAKEADVVKEDEEDDDEIEDEDLEDDEDVEEEDDSEDDVEDEDLDDEDDEDDEVSEDDEDEVKGEDPLAKLKDPVFKEGFDKGFKFARELAKLDALDMGKDSADELEDEEDDEEDDAVEDADMAEKDFDEEEDDEKKKASVVGDSVEALTKSITERINRSYQERIAASEKVKSLVGKVDIMAFDSADGIYEFALAQNGVDVKKYNVKAFEGMVDMMLEKSNKVELPITVGDSKPSMFGAGIDEAFERLKNIDR